jgi:hypothetical protein
MLMKNIAMTTTCRANVTETWVIEVPEDFDITTVSDETWRELLDNHHVVSVHNEVYDEDDREFDWAGEVDP